MDKSVSLELARIFLLRKMVKAVRSAAGTL